MERLAMEKLLKWKNSEKRKPLLLRGVRQCGKTYLLEEFGKRHFDNYVYIDLQRDERAHWIFDRGDLDPHRIIEEIGRYKKAEISAENTLIILDEIQTCGRALTSLKYFYQEVPEYHIAGAGSLLGVKIGKGSSFPTGKVNTVNLYPLSFREWLMAVGREEDAEYCEEHIFDMSRFLLDGLEDEYRRYLYVGGMPEAVETWIENHDPDAVREVQKEILIDYQGDILEHAPQDRIGAITAAWSSVPMQLGKENSRFYCTHVDGVKRASDLVDEIQWLVEAGMVVRVYCSQDDTVPPEIRLDRSLFKLYVVDPGLMSCMLDMDLDSFLDPEMYARASSDYRGAVAENFTATELNRVYGGRIYYWKNGKYEVDFLVKHKGRTVPIEVKSGWKQRARSLGVFMDRYDSKKAVLLSLGDPEDGKVVKIPIYLAWTVKGILDGSSFDQM
ncbi:MAG: ATP-binding protein [Thermoplasmata archaeon]|nr:ATP-binding protein [Thermoplasmata archaeon]